MMEKPNLALEKELQEFFPIAGVDEAGRGPLAGPLVVAACIWPLEKPFLGVNDSKKLSMEQREAIFKQITEDGSIFYSIVVICPEKIDEINILQATLEGMKEAVSRLPIRAGYALIDGNKIPEGMPCPSSAIVKGDGKSVSIAAASILAKVTRDRLMHEYHLIYPEYHFDRHMGYPTALHLEKLRQHGPCPIHRKSYGPVKKIFELRACPILDIKQALR